MPDFLHSATGLPGRGIRFEADRVVVLEARCEFALYELAENSPPLYRRIRSISAHEAKDRPLAAIPRKAR
jgi:hypothetical protein